MNISWLWLFIGIVVGYLVVPKLMGGVIGKKG